MKVLLRISLVLFFTSFSLSSFAITTITKNKPIPRFVGKNLSTNTLFRSVANNNSNKLMVIFKVNCLGCDLLLSELSEIEKQYKKLEIFAIHSGYERNSGKIAIENVLQYTNSLDNIPENIIWSTASLHKKLGFKHYPALILVNTDNQVVDFIEGGDVVEFSFFASAIEQYLTTNNWYGWNDYDAQNNNLATSTTTSDNLTKQQQPSLKNDSPSAIASQESGEDTSVENAISTIERDTASKIRAHLATTYSDKSIADKTYPTSVVSIKNLQPKKPSTPISQPTKKKSSLRSLLGDILED